jgi:uncharacterized membrane protein (DUF485 family)
MKKHYIEPIKNHPRFVQLQKERRRLAFILSLLVLVVYFAFILTIAFEPTLLSQTISEDSVITIGIPLGMFVIIFSFLMTGIYVYFANKQFDAYTQEIHADMMEL